MKKNGRLVSAIMLFAMFLSLTACGSKVQTVSCPAGSEHIDDPVNASENNMTYERDEYTDDINLKDQELEMYNGESGILQETKTDEKKASKSHVLSAAEIRDYPEYPDSEVYFGTEEELNDYMVKYAAWEAERTKLYDHEKGFDAALDLFYNKSISEFIGNGKTGKNTVYSPINVFMAFAMLTETASGETQKQLLDLFCVKDVLELRSLAKEMWETQYVDDGISKLLMANSLWLRDDTDYNEEVTGILANEYLADSFSGTMGNPEYTSMLREWLNEKTNGLLKESADGVDLTADTFMALASTVYFKRQWAEQFEGFRTKEADFIYEDGRTQKTMFLNSSSRGTLYEGDGFKAYAKTFRNGTRMWFVLPDEGTTPEELVRNTDVNAYLRGGIEWKNEYNGMIDFYVPKFDVQSDMDLIEGMNRLGVTDAFCDLADFSRLNPQFDGYVTDVLHSGRVIIDEEGCEAAAFTVMMTKTTALMPDPEPIVFRLDRPFYFEITGEFDVPLFAGTVNEP